MATEKVDSYLETKGSVQETTIIHSSFLSYAARSYYTLEFIAYGFHNRCILLVEILKIFWINMWEKIEPKGKV